MFRRLAVLSTLLSLPVFAAAPTVTTNSANSITASSAQLNGTANAGGEATTGWFRHSTTNPGTCDDLFGTRVPGTLGTAVGSGMAGGATVGAAAGAPPTSARTRRPVAAN